MRNKKSGDAKSLEEEIDEYIRQINEQEKVLNNLEEIIEIEAELNEYREEIEQLKLQADELLGDTSVLREQIEKLMKENNTPEVRTLDNRLAGIEYEVYKLIDKIETLNIDTISASVVREIERGIEREVETIKILLRQSKDYLYA